MNPRVERRQRVGIIMWEVSVEYQEFKNVLVSVVMIQEVTSARFVLSGDLNQSHNRLQLARKFAFTLF